MIQKHWESHLKIEKNYSLYEHIIKSGLDKTIYNKPGEHEKIDEVKNENARLMAGL